MRILPILLLLCGCATLERHPVATGFAVALVAGSIAASQSHDYRTSAPHPMASIGTPSCTGGTCQ
jgi:hypothetical protein